LLLHIIVINDANVKTFVIPFSSIESVDFEYSTDKEDKKEEMIIHNTNNSDSTIEKKDDDTKLCLRIFDETATNEKDAKFECASIREFEKDFIQAFNNYLQMISAYPTA
jgi:hypothetical protein